MLHSIQTHYVTWMTGVELYICKIRIFRLKTYVMLSHVPLPAPLAVSFSFCLVKMRAQDVTACRATTWLPVRHWSHPPLSVSLHHPPHSSAASLCRARRQRYLAHSNGGSCVELKSKKPSGEQPQSLHWAANATSVLPLPSPQLLQFRQLTSS